ncbi:hypothetical protein EV363DRAFT_1304251 [Boletus edulis]|nr:hypothetical protein EV363DRAFT_1304251 [Boletus edulis]
MEQEAEPAVRFGPWSITGSWGISITGSWGIPGKTLPWSRRLSQQYVLLHTITQASRIHVRKNNPIRSGQQGLFTECQNPGRGNIEYDAECLWQEVVKPVNSDVIQTPGRVPRTQPRKRWCEFLLPTEVWVEIIKSREQLRERGIWDASIMNGKYSIIEQGVESWSSHTSGRCANIFYPDVIKVYVVQARKHEADDVTSA